MDRNVFSHKEHIGHKEGSSFAEATEDKTGNGEREMNGRVERVERVERGECGIVEL